MRAIESEQASDRVHSIRSALIRVRQILLLPHAHKTMEAEKQVDPFYFQIPVLQHRFGRFMFRPHYQCLLKQLCSRCVCVFGFFSRNVLK